MPSRPLVLIAASVRSPERDVVVDGELDQHLRPVQFDRLDFTDPEARNLHARTGCQTAGFGEVRRVLLGLVDEGQFVVLQGDQHDRRGQTEADGAQDERTAFGERLHRGAHLPVGCPAIFTYTG